MAYNPNASHNLTYPNSNRPASITAFADAAPAGSYMARLRGEVAMCIREFGPDDEYTKSAEMRLHDHLMATDDQYRAAFDEQQAKARERAA